jgi:hypothetical protein
MVWMQSEDASVNEWECALTMMRVIKMKDEKGSP